LLREQPTETYVEARVKVRLTGRREVSALTFLSDRKHPQWAGALSLEAQAALIAGAEGLSGRNVDYLRDLLAQLRAEGIRDASLERLAVMVDARLKQS
jgi:cation transport protein ChaC